MKAFRALVVLLIGLGSVCFAQPNSAGNDSADVIYRFPNVANLGVLETRIVNSGSEGALDRMASRRHKVATAMGPVKLTPAQNHGVYFVPGTALISHPELLDAISPDNIAGFCFSFTSTGDAEDGIADRLVAKISHLKNLSLIRLVRCDVSDVGALGLHDLPQLKILDLSFTLITSKSIPVIGKLTSLENLTLNKVDLAKSDFSFIARLPKLSALYLRNSQVTDAMVTAIKSNKSLRVLDLANNTGITDASLATLASLPALRSLNLAGTSVNCRSLNKLSRIGKIVVSSRDLKGASLAILRKSLPNLSLDTQGEPAGLVNSPGAEEMHLFAPTRF